MIPVYLIQYTIANAKKFYLSESDYHHVMTRFKHWKLIESATALSSL